MYWYRMQIKWDYKKMGAYMYAFMYVCISVYMCLSMFAIIYMYVHGLFCFHVWDTLYLCICCVCMHVWGEVSMGACGHLPHTVN
jgi:hypothetical protein